MTDRIDRLAERTAALEARLTIYEQHASSRDQTLKEMDQKLDALISLRDKGFGAFWLASAVFGTGIVGAVTAIWHWLKG